MVPTCVKVLGISAEEVTISYDGIHRDFEADGMSQTRVGPK